jgi:hypothetical protein
MHERTMHATLREFATCMIKQQPSQSVTQYRLAFEVVLLTAIDIGCDAMVAHFFVACLLPRLQPRCLHDYAGRPHDTFEESYQHALAVEQHYLTAIATGKTAPGSVAAVQGHFRKKAKFGHADANPNSTQPQQPLQPGPPRTAQRLGRPWWRLWRWSRRRPWPTAAARWAW